MAKVDTQNVPGELAELYGGSLEFARVWKTHTTVRNRYPWRLPHMQGNGRIRRDYHKGWDFTNLQFEQRKIFRKSCDCYNLQLLTHDIIDPPAGPKSRGYWYWQGVLAGIWYYNYFMQQTINGYLGNGAPTWCRKLIIADSWVELANPDANYGDDDDLYTENWQGGHTEIYVTKNDPKTNIYHFFLQYVMFYPHVDGGHIHLDFYEVADVIDEMGITWNNKPTLGKQIATISLGQFEADVWKEIEIPNVKAFAIITRPPAPLSPYNYGMATQSRDDDPEYEEVPYWT